MQIPLPYMESAARLWLRVQEMAGFDSVISDTFPLVSPPGPSSFSKPGSDTQFTVCWRPVSALPTEAEHV